MITEVNPKMSQCRSRIEALLVEQFGEFPGVESMAERLMSEYAEYAQMLPSVPKTELDWVTGRLGSSGRQNDVLRRMEAGNGQADPNGRGDGTDADDGRDRTNGTPDD
jgi:hypothetical protein